MAAIELTDCRYSPIKTRMRHPNMGIWMNTVHAILVDNLIL